MRLDISKVASPTLFRDYRNIGSLLPRGKDSALYEELIRLFNRRTSFEELFSSKRTNRPSNPRLFYVKIWKNLLNSSILEEYHRHSASSNQISEYLVISYESSTSFILNYYNKRPKTFATPKIRKNFC